LRGAGFARSDNKPEYATERPDGQNMTLIQPRAPMGVPAIETGLSDHSKRPSQGAWGGFFMDFRRMRGVPIRPADPRHPLNQS
jgi:hypothetical protein